jgi:hypothetical protein
MSNNMRSPSRGGRKTIVSASGAFWDSMFGRFAAWCSCLFELVADPCNDVFWGAAILEVVSVSFGYSIRQRFLNNSAGTIRHFL